ncbi:type II toxin-antitoxin system RelE/ParE family toxin [Parapedobacter sp. SGR-10]|uniref:type II toxin-antitoxin system RelE/ParE family toxin n=1 Tax=Parapedobacter sp. SGR-10 TaxID=2710879 RepID=UPI0013D0E612|nr:type II toxin-antitoxin system RelE/ParE family toxin [Parapedobacter sp. SGR-10]NGF55077.1 type II toxin-antitoxin system RelE/ParE family toxin [Parapedobacter sp. SGR-10]
MAKFFLTHKAVEDLSKIWDYTYEVWSENQADKYYKLLMESCRTIAEDPNKGKSYATIAIDILGFHVGKHIVFYRVLTSTEIEVIRILHERMDLRSRITD